MADDVTDQPIQVTSQTTFSRRGI